MNEYIKREYAVDAVLDVYCDTPDIDLSCEKFEAAIRKIQAADVAPVQHGRWITTSGEVFPGSSQFLCYSHKHEECGFQYVDMDENEYDFCPNCGAKMDLEDTNG